MRTIQIFNQEINSCKECIFNHITFKNKYEELHTCLQLNKNIDDYIAIEEIPTNCPFIKPLSKEDIESFGFEYNNEEQFYHKRINYYFYYIYRQNNIDFIITVYAVTTTETLDKCIFDGKITSKPHLEFILKSLNII